MSEDMIIGKIEQLTQATGEIPKPTLSMPITKSVLDAAKMAAKVMAGKDWHTLTMREYDLVRYLFRAKLIEKENDNGFVGRSI